MRFLSTPPWKTICVLGNVELKGRFLHLSTNSEARAKEGIVLIRQALSDIFGTPLTEIRTIGQMMAERPPREHGGAASDVPPELPSGSSTSSWTGNIVKRLISRSACSATKRHVRPQNQPLADRRSPNGSNISKTSPQPNRIPPPMETSVSSGCGRNSASTICVDRAHYRRSVSQ